MSQRDGWRLATPFACVVCLTTAASIAVITWWNCTHSSDSRAECTETEMGQTKSSGFVVEIAGSKLNEGWKALPTEEEDDSDVSSSEEINDSNRYLPQRSLHNLSSTQSTYDRPWRITVNPAEAAMKRLASHNRSVEKDDKRQARVSELCGLGKREILGRMTGFSGDQYRQEVRRTCDAVYGLCKVLSADEARCLVLALDIPETKGNLLKLLTSISNLAAFTANQNLFREAGIIPILRRMLKQPALTTPNKIMLMQCVANLAINDSNQPLLKEAVPTILKKFSMEGVSELERMVCIQALTNLSVNIGQNEAAVYTAAIPISFNRLWSHGEVNLAALRLLVNLSCSVDLVPHILAAKAPAGLLSILDFNQSEEILVRFCTLLLWLTSAVDSLNITYSDVKQLNLQLFISEMQTVYWSLFGPVGMADVCRRLPLLKYHKNEEIAYKSSTIASLLTNIVVEHDEKECKAEATASNLMQL